MKYFIVHAHPEPNSFNAALTKAAAETLPGTGNEVVVSDLYAMDWEPRSDRRNFTTVADPSYYKQQEEETLATDSNGFSLDIAAEQEKLFQCDALVLQFPMWWFGMPAILKGWVDRVFARRRVYGEGYWFDNGRLIGRRAMLSVTIGGSPTAYDADGLNGDVRTHLYSLEHMLRFVGFEVVPSFISWSPARIGDAARKDYIAQYLQRLRTLPDAEPLNPMRLEQFDSATFKRKA